MEVKNVPRFICVKGSFIEDVFPELDSKKFYTFCRRGWRPIILESGVQVNEEVLYINELDEWYPLRCFDILEDLSPN